MKTMKVNEKIVKVRLAELELTQFELAEQLGLRPTTLNGYVRSRHPIPAGVLSKLAKALGLTEQQLMGRGDDHE